MDIEKLIERVIDELADIRGMDALGHDCPEGRENAASTIRAAFAEVRRAALIDACKAICSSCADGSAWYGSGPGYHCAADTAPWQCEAKDIRALLPPVAEGVE